jgi:hypothetical protein
MFQKSFRFANGLEKKQRSAREPVFPELGTPPLVPYSPPPGIVRFECMTVWLQYWSSYLELKFVSL